MALVFEANSLKPKKLKGQRKKWNAKYAWDVGEKEKME